MPVIKFPGKIEPEWNEVYVDGMDSLSRSMTINSADTTIVSLYNNAPDGDPWSDLMLTFWAVFRRVHEEVNHGLLGLTVEVSMLENESKDLVMYIKYLDGEDLAMFFEFWDVADHEAERPTIETELIDSSWYTLQRARMTNWLAKHYTNLGLNVSYPSNVIKLVGKDTILTFRRQNHE